MAEAYLVPELAPLNRHKLGALTSMGRHPENTVEVPDRSVSKFHAQVQRTPSGVYVVQDLGSRNGTYIGGQRIERQPLKDGDDLVLGTVRFRFHAERSTAGLTSSIRVADVVKATGGAALTVLGPVTGLGVALHEGDSAIEASATYDVGQDRFLPSAEVRDIDALRRDYDKLRIAHELNSTLRLDAPVDDLLGQIARRSFDLIPADRCAILLMGSDGKSLQPRVVMKRGGGEPEEAMPLSQTVLDEVVRNKKAVLATDAITDGRFQAAASIVALSMRSAMCVPLIYEDEIFGAMHVDSLQRAHAFTPKDLQIFASIANQTAAALKNASLLQQVEAEAQMRARLGRLLSPNLVEEVVAGKIDLTKGGELRDAAVMFTDIRGFTAMSARMGAEEVTALLNEYFEVMVDVVFDLGGTLDKYMGDAIMALFGVPKEDPESVQKAVRCALKMEAVLRSLNRVRVARGETEIKMGVGINAGRVVWGPLGSRRTMDYTVIGDVVNVASRLCAHAEPSQIIVSSAVKERLGEGFVLVDLPPARLKGKDEPVLVWNVVGEKGTSLG